MKFKNKKTGVIEETNNKMIIEQFELLPEIYEEIKEKTNKKGETPQK